ncbi:MAG TPA: Tat pathway signal protein [Caulobacteraceae bacterium]|jgi:hypothetical protein
MRAAPLFIALSLAAAVPSAAYASGGKKSDATYIPLRPVTLTIVRPTGGRGALTVEVGLDAPDRGLRERAAASGPLLRDAYIAALQPYAMRLGPGAPPNLEVIGAALQRETDRVLKAKGARVLLGAVLVN